MHPLITRDPVSGGELVVTRLECPSSGVAIEGRFSLGWIGRLSPEQLEFVELLVRSRGNLQKVAAELRVAYNTARNRMDDIVVALSVPADAAEGRDRSEILDHLSDGTIEFEEALRLLRG